MKKKRRIWFCGGIEQAVAQPDLLARLRDEIGLTTIMPESPICHTSGFATSDELAKRGPFEDWRSRADLYPRIAEGIYPPVAGIISGFDDTPLKKLIESAQKTGIEVWGHIGLWSYGGDVYPEYAMRDIEGEPLDMRYKQWGIGLCPSRKEINDWTRDGLIDAAQRYALDGFCVDHARYAAPANVHGLFACGCAHCQREGAALGYDVARLYDGLRHFRQSLKTLDRRQISRMIAHQPNLWDFLNLCEGGAELLEWFRMRAGLLAARMAEFRNAINEATGTKPFGSDVFPPSVALLGGHDYTAWQQGADYLTGGSSFGGVVGWATMVTNLAGAWAPALCRTINELQEDEALALIYRLFGYEDLDLPLTLAGLQEAQLPLPEIFAREVGKLKAVADPNIGLYPPLSVSAAPDIVQALCEAVVDNEGDGAMLTFGATEEAIESVLQLDLAQWLDS